MRTFAKAAGIAALAVALAPAGAAALDLGGLEVHGFVSQGYVQSSDNQWSSLDTEEGTWAYTEEALNFNARPLEGLRVGMQLLGRDFGSEGNHEVTVDWALGDYRWKSWLGLKAGRVKLPFGLYNELMDADMARPELFQPLGMYPVNQRDMLNAYDGVGLYGNIKLGKAGDLDYDIYGGTMDIDDSRVVRQSVEDGAYAGLQPLKRMGIDSFSVGDISAGMDKLYGGTLTWNSPVEGLRFRGSLYTTDSDFTSSTTYSGWMNAGGQPVPLSITTQSAVSYEQEYNYIISAEYQRGNLRLSGEHWKQRTHMTVQTSGLPFPMPAMETKETSFSCYAQAAYRFTDWFQASTYYSVLYMDADDMDGDNYVKMGQQADRAWQKDLAFTARFDITPWWLFKVEVHSMDGTGTLRLVDNQDGLEKDWWLFVAKTTFYF